MITINEVIQSEERLRIAMLNNDVSELDRLISNDLQFLLFDGTVITKEDDLESHRVKLMKLTVLDQSDQRVKIHESSAVVTVKANLEGSFADNPIKGTFRYLRVWQKTSHGLQIIAGSVTQG